MDILKTLGALALGSRLKRLSDRLMQDGIKVYRDTGIDFEPRWFPVFYFLKQAGPTAVMNIARGLGISHPSVNQIAAELVRHELVAAYRDPKDKRKRVLALTSLGKQRYQALQPIWRDIELSLEEILTETQVDLLGYIETLERVIDRKGFHARFEERHQPHSADFDLVWYEPRYREAFYRINEAWILEFFELEEADRQVIEHPEAYVIEPGGDIVFALDKRTGEVVGTCALIHRGETLSELAKMGVLSDYRGRGLGKLLGYACLARAREMGFLKIYLESNSALAPALGLYRQLGFERKASPFNSDYVRADVYMDMEL